MATTTLDLQMMGLSCKPCIVISVHCSSGICMVGRNFKFCKRRSLDVRGCLM